MKIADLRIFNPAAYLADEATIAAFLAAARQDGDPRRIAEAIAVVARARGAGMNATSDPEAPASQGRGRGPEPCSS